MPKKKARIRRVLSAALLITCLLVGSAGAQDTLKIDIFGPGQKRINMYVATPVAIQGESGSSAWSEVKPIALEHLDYLPFITLIQPGEILGGAEPGGYKADSIDFRKYGLSQVDLIMTAAYEPRSGMLGRLELRVYEVFTQRLVLGRAYGVESQEQLPLVLRKFFADFMDTVAGNGDFFRSKLAFVKKEGQSKEIWAISPLGTNLRKLTSLTGLNLSPEWSKDGSELIFTHVDGLGHRLGIWNSSTGAATLHDVPGNTLIGPAFIPGGDIAVSLDFGGNPDIYHLGRDFKVKEPIVENWAIDISPSFDASGEKMAFVSSRFGNPHIFLLDRKTGEVRRITYDGKYNTSPSISPGGDLIAFSRMTPEGHRIFVHEIRTGRETQASFGPGNDETPVFAPDDYFLAFASNRNGTYRIYITNRFGEDPKPVQTGEGEAISPAWVVENRSG
ncbi:MAG: hypothetical protein ACLFTB_05400 [Desulfovibrionales bacterium]